MPLPQSWRKEALFNLMPDSIDIASKGEAYALFPCHFLDPNKELEKRGMSAGVLGWIAGARYKLPNGDCTGKYRQGNDHR